VETAGEPDALAALGCTRLQGYFLGRPMPAAQFEAWVAQRPALANRVSA